jgi:hypothetical protein
MANAIVKEVRDRVISTVTKRGRGQLFDRYQVDATVTGENLVVNPAAGARERVIKSLLNRGRDAITDRSEIDNLVY